MKHSANVVKRASVAVAVAAAAALIGAAPASAASAGMIDVCSYGNYATQVEFPNRGGFSTWIVSPGSCQSTWIGYGRVNEPINIYGFFPHKVWLRGATFCGAIGGFVGTYGSSSANWVAVPARC
ncbi:hypothetical protein [Lentzea flava]|uniref:Peptidase inhibitor family I36 n=1 Tax=Lentzea flava TaxID=103732 RepID=A0ABQ2VAS1_9PSEU|nr:hypothetical protein [Lentzea flava]MCP2204359.1 hypothetical protein [Lentzea flava]GGU76713.1 hypothetical protein GCM10010178_79880 [Lentzea flava]